MVLGLLAAAVGVWLAGTADTAPGATIVVLAIAGFLARRRRRRRLRGRSADGRYRPPASVSAVETAEAVLEPRGPVGRTGTIVVTVTG